MEDIRDRLGMPIDPGIKELVVGLCCWKIETTGSCEGHQDRGLPYPWIGVRCTSLAKLEEAISCHQRSSKSKDKIRLTIEGLGILAKRSLRLVPRDRGLPLAESQAGARVFGKFLQKNLPILVKT